MHQRSLQRAGKTDDDLLYRPNHVKSHIHEVEDLQYQYDKSSMEIRRTSTDSNPYNYQQPLNNDILFTWANKDQFLAKVLILLNLIHLKQQVQQSNNNRTDTRTIRKGTGKLKKSTPSSSSHFPRSKSNTTNNSKANSKHNSSSSKRHHKPKQKQPSKKTQMKSLLEKLDKDSAQYKVLHWDHTTLRKITKDELSKHIIPSSAHITKIKISEKPDGIWMMIHGFIFNIVGLLEVHPGGAECLLDCAGVDATRVFDDVGHSDIAWEMLENCCVGIIEDFDVSDNEEDDTIDEEHINGDDHDPESEMVAELDDPEEDPNVATTADILIWNHKAVEYSGFIILALFGLFCFVILQRKKWDQWSDISTSSTHYQNQLHKDGPVYGNAS